MLIEYGLNQTYRVSPVDNTIQDQVWNPTFGRIATLHYCSLVLFFLSSSVLFYTYM